MAAETLGITATRLKSFNLIDRIVDEPLGGAHRDPALMMQSMKKALQDALDSLTSQPLDSPAQNPLRAPDELWPIQGHARQITCWRRCGCDWTRHVPPGSRITLGLSGGVDSVVLLDLLARLAADHPFQLCAIHVNHQISPRAQDWADACRTLCSTHHIPLQVQTIRIEDAATLGPRSRRAARALCRIRAPRYRLHRAGAPPRRPGRNAAAATAARCGGERPGSHAGVA